MKRQPTFTLECDCGGKVQFKNGHGGKCNKCGTPFGGSIHKASKPHSRKKAASHHSLDPRDWWILPALIVAGVIGYGMYMDGLLWLFALMVSGLIILRILTGKKGRRA